jgi:predicted patatin/cPLA2 family phospholipase
VIKSGSRPGERSDGKKIALAIEGGGMRGCVSAGMATAVWYLGLKDSVDIVYVSYKFNNKTYIIFSIKSFIDYFNNN